MSIYLKIRNKYETLSKSEQRVARYCLDNFYDVSKYSLAQLAEKANCGEATIFRFCRKLNIKSFHDFKEAISVEISENFKEDATSFITDVYNSIQQSIEYTILNLDHEQLNEITQLIFNANRIFCAGVGNSGIPAEACAMRFLRNGKNGIFIKDNHFQLIYLNELNENDIAILFSISGESTDTVDCARILKEKNVKVISITSSIVSTLAKVSDYHILIKKWSGPVAGGSMIAQISQMYIADLITTRVGMIDIKHMMRSKEITFDYVLPKLTEHYNNND